MQESITQRILADNAKALELLVEKYKAAATTN